MVESVIQIKSGITINDSARVRNIIRVEEITFGILLHVAAKIINI